MSKPSKILKTWGILLASKSDLCAGLGPSVATELRSRLRGLAVDRLKARRQVRVDRFRLGTNL